MKLIVNPHKIEIEKEPVNEREINISKCQFEFADEITDDYVKEAYFTFEGETYKQIIVNDECDFPSEVLVKKGTVEIGVVAFLVENETEIKRYNPSPAYFDTWQGSLKDDYENSEPITPTDKEQIEQAITNLQNDVDDLEENKQDTLVSGENIKTINGESLLGKGDIKIDQDFVKDNDYVHTDNNYTDAEKEKLASLENYDDTDIKNDISDIKDEQRTQNGDISQNKADIEALSESLANYSLITETGSQIALNINSSNYQMTAILKDKNGNIIYTSNVIDLPIESMIINVTYDSSTKEIVFTLQNGNTLRVSVADLVSGLVSTDELATILSSYYTKTEVDNLLSSKANSSDVYTKSQTDNLLNVKADSSNVYTKSETDNLLSSKANSSDVYSKSEADNLLNAKVDTTTFNESQAEQDTNINALNSLVDQLPRVSGTGTDLSLQDVLNYRLMKFMPMGNSSQESTTGKNILNMNNFEDNGTGRTTFTANENSITITTTSSGTYRYVLNTINNLTIGETYTFSFGSYQDGSNGLAQFGIVNSQGNYYNYSKYLTETQKMTFTPTETSATVRIGYLSSNVAQNISLKVNNIQLEKGSTNTSYEPYTGGIPAPSPSYPFPVKVVTGENSLIVQNENLFDLSKATIGYEINGGDGTISPNASYVVSDYIPVIPNSDYYLAKEAEQGVSNCFYDKNKNFIQTVSKNKGVITVPNVSTIAYIRFNFHINTKDTVMFIKGSTAPTSYIAHQEQNYSISLGNIELCKIGNYQDYIYKSGDNWYKKQVIYKKIFTGDDDWLMQYGTGLFHKGVNNLADIRGGFCNNYKYNSAQSGMYNNLNNYEFGLQYYSSANRSLFIKDTNYSTPEAFQSYLGELYTNNNPLILYYPLETPTDVQIIDTTLIEQLNNIYNNAYSYNGTTNVTTTYASGNEQMVIEASALMDLNSLVTRIETLESEV